MVATKKRSIKPITGGTTFTATSFDVMMLVDSSGAPSQIRVRFYDAAGKSISDGMIKPVTKATPQITQTALSAILNTPAQAGETLPQLLLRAATPYVQTTYGVTLIPG